MCVGLIKELRAESPAVAVQPAPAAPPPSSPVVAAGEAPAGS